MVDRILIDGGQTGTRVRVIVDGAPPVDYPTGPIRTDRPVVPQLGTYLHDVLAEARVTLAPNTELAVGVSGLTPEHSKPTELLGACRDLGVVRVALAHDSVSAYLGCNGWDYGAIVAVGTGIVGLGVSPAAVTRVDGWGHLFGDAGSGFWIGRAGIDAALRAFDGRAEQTALVKDATAQFGPLPELYIRVQSDPDRVSKVAGFAVTVAEQADSGDPVARSIIATAADELAHTACTAATVGHPAWSGPPRISWTGKVLSANDSMRTRFIERVRDTLPDANVAEPRGKPLDGVAQLLNAPAGHPLAAMIETAAS